MSFSLYQLLCFFLAYAFLGWCTEVAYAAVTLGKLVNRGFLNGPWCPIYGFGMLTALLCLTPIQHNWLLLFLGGMALASAIELIGGWVLYKAYHTRWWDYTHEPFNLGGFICLRFSLLWGLGVVLVMRVIHPSVAGLIGLLPQPVGWFLLALLYLVFAADLIATLFTVSGLHRDLNALDEITTDLREVSDALTALVGSKAIQTDQRLDEAQLQLLLAKAEARSAAAEVREHLDEALDDLREDAATHSAATREKLDELWLDSELRRAELEARRTELEQRLEQLQLQVVGRRWFGERRLLQAFPKMSNDRHANALEQLRQTLNERHPSR